jgi:hypothetical protein
MGRLWERPPPRDPHPKLRPRGWPVAISTTRQAAPRQRRLCTTTHTAGRLNPHPFRLTVAGTGVGLRLDGSDFKFGLGPLPSTGGTACLDFSRGEPPCKARPRPMFSPYLSYPKPAVAAFSVRRSPSADNGSNPSHASPPRTRLQPLAASAACNDASKLCGAGGCGGLLVTNKYAKAAGGRNTTCCVGLGESGTPQGVQMPLALLVLVKGCVDVFLVNPKLSNQARKAFAAMQLA